MARKEIIALLLAGGQGSRLGVLTKNIAKPAVLFGGKYRIIDFTLSNCINSNIDTVGVLTQYQPLKLHSHIGIGNQTWTEEWRCYDPHPLPAAGKGRMVFGHRGCSAPEYKLREELHPSMSSSCQATISTR